MKELNIEKLKQYADRGLLTDTSIINACELNPELLKTIDVKYFVTVTDLGEDAEDEPAVIEPAVIEPAVIEPAVVIEQEESLPTETEPEPVATPEIVVEEKEEEPKVEVEQKTTKTKKN